MEQFTAVIHWCNKISYYFNCMHAPMEGFNRTFSRLVIYSSNFNRCPMGQCNAQFKTVTYRPNRISSCSPCNPPPQWVFQLVLTVVIYSCKEVLNSGLSLSWICTFPSEQATTKTKFGSLFKVQSYKTFFAIFSPGPDIIKLFTYVMYEFFFNKLERL